MTGELEVQTTIGEVEARQALGGLAVEKTAYTGIAEEIRAIRARIVAQPIVRQVYEEPSYGMGG